MTTRHSLVLTFGLCATMMLSCKDAKDNNATEALPAKAADTAVPNNSETETKVAAVFNANLVTEGDLETLGLSTEVIFKILESQPFNDMKAMDTLLGEFPKKEALYEQLFVPLNLNTTPKNDFKMIPGVGDRMAHEFDEYRPYKSIKQFRKEIGKYVDSSEVARYEQYVFVPVELNTASEEDIKALPGVGNRMAHEFEEYRPYKNMAQFRKEIGKYVDDQELQRLERLVYLAD